ncbi:alpha/beta hydrolase [Sunxiuqinia elliptica]|uniref:Acetyl esterase/lipase n=1 Tax=Sunxiuqinia elliptica TaxID=655355 RepID=A0A4R6GQS9_9BACT|nr:alpha/beta hydrolase [Sunxiuqinia elliptica]TDN97692.1 acetyl esterase/lipase [Sunxiuqinia elliptica]TDO67047.1 acetyl esterase/lipase [Sunxiuqinia elliptica]
MFKLLLTLVLLFVFMMSSPRLLGWLYPNRAPVGYHFEELDYLAVGVGLESLVERKPTLPYGIHEIKNIEYKRVGERSLQLDLYLPKQLNEQAPLLVFIHGGGWRSGKRADYLPYLIDFAEKGYATATVSYRLVKDSIYPACVEDIQDAMHWVFQNGESYGYDTSRVALIGGSAGAHLAMLAAYGWYRGEDKPAKFPIKAVVDIYGPVDFRTEYAQNQPLVTGFIGHAYDEKPELYWEASPARYLSADDPPTLILQGTSDQLLPPSQSDWLKEELDRLGVPCEYYRFPLWPHAMDVVQRVNDYAQLKMDSFFEKHLL